MIVLHLGLLMLLLVELLSLPLFWISPLESVERQIKGSGRPQSMTLIDRYQYPMFAVRSTQQQNDQIKPPQCQKVLKSQRVDIFSFFQRSREYFLIQLVIELGSFTYS